MKQLSVTLALLALMIFSSVTYGQTSGSNNPVSDELYAAIDQKVIAEMNVLQRSLELNSEQITTIESILLKTELEKEIAISSSASSLDKVIASVNSESTKDNELKEVLTIGQYKMYKLNKLATN